MRSDSYPFLLSNILAVFLLFTGVPDSQAQNAEPEEQLQLFFYLPDGPSHFLVVEKKHQRLKLFEQNDGLRMLREFNCATGENAGTKKTSGDARTPEGIYHITEIYEDKRITVFGSRAFHLDYPNAFDTHAGRLGDGIFIHGTNKKLIANSTNGCITLNNTDLDELAPYLTVNSIPIIILDTESELVLGDNLLLQKNGSQFKDALEKLSFNSGKIPIDNIKSLSYIKRGEQIVVSIHYILFDDKLTQYSERKRAYLTQIPAGNLRTLYAVQQQDTTPKILAVRPTKTSLVEKTVADPVVAAESSAPKPTVPTVKPVIPAAKPPAVLAKSDNPGGKSARPVSAKPAAVEKGQDKNQDLMVFVEKWRAAWVAKDIESYINCYSPSFKSGNLNRQEWRAKKHFLNQKYKYISVNIRHISIEWTSIGANVTFQQIYKSDQIQSSGTKTLQLVNKKNRWMIENEII